MRALLAGLLVVWIAATNARAVEFSTVEAAGKRYTVCRVDAVKERLRLYWRDERGGPFRRLDHLAEWLAARRERLVFAMNAGMYHGDLAPVGLLIADGRTLSPLNGAEGQGNFFLKPNGVFYMTDKGAAILETAEFARLNPHALLATQSGPLLVRKGVIHPAFRAESRSRLYRNGVGVADRATALFVISDEPVNFHEFATLFREVLHCPDALFLDGTISSLYAPALKRSDFRMNLGPIIGVTDPNSKVR